MFRLRCRPKRLRPVVIGIIAKLSWAPPEAGAFGLEHAHDRVVDAIHLHPLADRAGEREEIFGQAVAQHADIPAAVEIGLVSSSKRPCSRTQLRAGKLPGVLPMRCTLGAVF